MNDLKENPMAKLLSCPCKARPAQSGSPWTAKAAGLADTAKSAAISASELLASKASPRLEAAWEWASPRVETAWRKGITAAAPKVEEAARALAPRVDDARDAIVERALPAIVARNHELICKDFRHSHEGKYCKNYNSRYEIHKHAGKQNLGLGPERGRAVRTLFLGIVGLAFHLAKTTQRQQPVQRDQRAFVLAKNFRPRRKAQTEFLNFNTISHRHNGVPQFVNDNQNHQE
jgi:hypothetical protein